MEIEKINTPYFKFFPQDFLSSSDVQLMNCEEIGAYCLLLFNSFLQKRKGFLKNDEKYLMRICKLSAKKWNKISPTIMNKFITTDDGFIYNERLVFEIQQAEKTIKTNILKTQKARETVIEKRLSHTQLQQQLHRNKSPVTRSVTEFVTSSVTDNVTDGNKDTDTEEDTDTHNIFERIEIFISHRQRKFDAFPNEFKNRLLDDFLISKPVVYTTDSVQQPYQDLVELIFLTTGDEDWIMQISRSFEMDFVRQKLTDFINYNLQSQCFRNEKYLTHYEFQQHFANKFLKK